MYVAAGAIAGLLAVVLLFLYPGYLRQKPAPLKPSADSSPLALRVERTGNEILLTWRPDSDAVRNVTQAVLAISDGPQQDNVTLDPSQFRNGRIVYSPVTSDVVFRMEVSGQGGNKVASESLRVLGNRPSAFDAASAAAAAAKTAVPGQPPVTGAVPPEEVPAEEAPVKKPTPLRPFNAEPLAQRLRAAGPTDLPDAPLVAAVDTSNPAVALNLGVATPVPPPPSAAPAAAAPSAAAPAAPPAATKSAARVTPAEVIRRVTPDYPKMARDSNLRGTVEIKARIGVDGKVTKIEGVTGPVMLQRPAIDAVKQWVYRPTLLNGQAVESDTLISLRFGN